MKEKYSFEIINGRSFIYKNNDDEASIGQTIRLDNQNDLINVELTEENKIKEIEVTFINRNINTDSISIGKENLTKRETLPRYPIPERPEFILNYNNENLNIILSVEDNKIRSYYEDGTMTYYLNEKNELVMLEKALGKEEKEYFEYILSPLPISEPAKVIEEISRREGINIIEASFLGDESWEERIVDSNYHLRFIYDDKDKPGEITYPNEKSADIKGIGVRELFKRLENDDLESYEMLYSGYRLFIDDYVSEIIKFTRDNINYNNILRKYLEIQKGVLAQVKEGDIVPTNFLLDFIRRAQLMRNIEVHNRYPAITYDYAFGSDLPYLAYLTPLKDALLEYRKEKPLIIIDKDQIELMEHLTNYTVPEEDNNYDIAARDELLSKADDLSKKPQRKI